MRGLPSSPGSLRATYPAPASKLDPSRNRLFRERKGSPSPLGVIALALVTGGTVKAIIDCFKTYLSRERALTIKLARADGAHVEITARNVDTAAVREALKAATAAKSQ
jgi:hypothetical protein